MTVHRLHSLDMSECRLDLLSQTRIERTRLGIHVQCFFQECPIRLRHTQNNKLIVAIRVIQHDVVSLGLANEVEQFGDFGGRLSEPNFFAHLILEFFQPF